MNSSSNQKLNKIDAIIVVTLIIIAGLVLTKAGVITTPLTEKQEPRQPLEPVIPPPIPTPPTSLSSEYVGFLRAVSPEDEGLHFDKITICREWWYFTAIFSD